MLLFDGRADLMTVIECHIAAESALRQIERHIVDCEDACLCLTDIRDGIDDSHRCQDIAVIGEFFRSFRNTDTHIDLQVGIAFDCYAELTNSVCVRPVFRDVLGHAVDMFNDNRFPAVDDV